MPENFTDLEKELCEAITKYAKKTGSCVDSIRVRYTSTIPGDLTCAAMTRMWIESLDIVAFLPAKELMGKWSAEKE